MRSLRTRPIFRIVAAMCFLASVGVGGRAWACVPQPLVSLQPTGSGPAGGEVTVNGVSVAGDAEIRWNGLQGPLLATVAGPAFTSKVKVPAADPGLYTIIVLERTPSGGVGSTGRAAYLVTSGGPAPAPGAATPPAGTEPTGEAPVATGSRGDGLSPVLAGAGGVVLLALGAVGGLLLSGKRSSQPADGMTAA